MPNSYVTTTSPCIEEKAVAKFKVGLQGNVLRPADDGYDAARKLYNAMIDRHPAMIVRCRGVADVIRAIDFSHSHDLLVAIRGGGHNVAGKAMCDGGLVIDLSPMKGVRVDPAERTARAEAGLTWGELDRETQNFGLATTGGTISTTGIAGLTLGGGLGWLMRTHGLACDNLLSLDVVTADGRFLTASTTENPDLFWGMRGGGANFGVVTSFEYRLHPVSSVLGGMVVHPIERAGAVLRFYRDFIQTAPDQLTAIPALLTPPGGTPVIAVLIGYIGSVTAGEQAAWPLRAFGPPLADEVRPMAYTELQTMLDASFPSGLYNYWKSNFLKGLSDGAIDTIVSHFATVPSPLSAVVIEHLGGAVSRVGRDETAFNLRDGQLNLAIISRWADPAQSETHMRWARQFWGAMQPYSTDAVYVNYLHDEGEARVRAAYGGSYERLVTLKNTYDPTNFFRLNHNISPTV